MPHVVLLKKCLRDVKNAIIQKLCVDLHEWRTMHEENEKSPTMCELWMDEIITPDKKWHLTWSQGTKQLSAAHNQAD